VRVRTKQSLSKIAQSSQLLASFRRPTSVVDPVAVADIEAALATSSTRSRAGRTGDKVCGNVGLNCRASHGEDLVRDTIDLPQRLNEAVSLRKVPQIDAPIRAFHLLEAAYYGGILRLPEAASLAI
jgi:hypothetical protein